MVREGRSPQTPHKKMEKLERELSDRTEPSVDITANLFRALAV